MSMSVYMPSSGMVQFVSGILSIRVWALQLHRMNVRVGLQTPPLNKVSGCVERRRTHATSLWGSAQHMHRWRRLQCGRVFRRSHSDWKLWIWRLGDTRESLASTWVSVSYRCTQFGNRPRFMEPAQFHIWLIIKPLTSSSASWQHYKCHKQEHFAFFRTAATCKDLSIFTLTSLFKYSAQILCLPSMEKFWIFCFLNSLAHSSLSPVWNIFELCTLSRLELSLQLFFRRILISKPSQYWHLRIKCFCFLTYFAQTSSVL